MRASALRVWMYTVPGPVNRQTRPSSVCDAENSPPAWIRSTLYWAVQATRCPLSTEKTDEHGNSSCSDSLLTNPLLARRKLSLYDGAETLHKDDTATLRLLHEETFTRD